MITKSKYNMNIYLLAVLLVISTLLFGIYPANAQEQLPQAVDLSGEELFIQSRCVRCHTIGRGRFVGPDLAGIKDKYSKEEIVKWIENPQQVYQETGKMPFNEGYPPMPPMQIPPKQAQAIADYIISAKLPESDAQSGSISGQVINKTNDTPEEGIELVLTAYMGDRPTDKQIATSDKEGNFKFENLMWDRSYGISINFRGAEYSTDKMVFLPKEDTKTLTLPIFEPTVEEGDIEVVESHMIVQSEGDKLSVADLSLFNNSGERIFVGGNELEDGRKESLRFNTPKGAQSISFIHGVNPEDIVETDYGFADTTSIMPGQKRVVYTYELPLGSGTASFEKIIDYPTASFLLLISDSERTAEIQGLTGGETKQIQGQSYQQWSGSDLKPGHIIKVDLLGPVFKVDYIKWGALGVLGVILIIAIIYSFVSKGKTEEVENKESQDVKTEKIRLDLIKEIAFLDDSFEAGQIGEEKYKRLRKEKFEALKNYRRRL